MGSTGTDARRLLRPRVRRARHCRRDGGSLRAFHRTIKGVAADGHRYHALEPEAYASVHATLADAIVRGHARLGDPLEPLERERFWLEWRAVGRLLGIRSGELPEDWRQFEAYVAGMVRGRLEHTAAVDDVLATLAAPGPPPLPLPLRAGWPLAGIPLSRALTLVTIGMLPPVLLCATSSALLRLDPGSPQVAARESSRRPARRWLYRLRGRVQVPGSYRLHGSNPFGPKMALGGLTRRSPHDRSSAMSARTQPPRPARPRHLPRLAITKAEAADALGVSVDFLEDHVRRELRVVRRGRRLLIPLDELAGWIDRNSQRTLPPS